LFFASGGNFAASVAGDTVLFLTLAFICEAEPAQCAAGADSHAGGDLIKPLISALYFGGMLQLVNFILSCYMFAFSGALPASFSLWSYFWKTIEGTFLLLWTLFYYRIARNMTAKAPLSFSLLTIFTPLAGLAIVAVSVNSGLALQAPGHRFIALNENIFLCGGLFGTLIVGLNMCVFYLYTKLSVAHEALIFARDLAHTPPVWTPEQGLSAAFIEKYEITPREREVIEILVRGKTGKEIAVELDMALNTVQVHLKRIYRKTGTAGRFALSALVTQKIMK
jgi:DNA-binding CsgD family transcriptional regulator